MKKVLSSILIAMILILGAVNIPAYTYGAKSNSVQTNTGQQDIKKMFEQRLNLTEKQKQKAAEIHKQGRKQIQPVMMNLDLKRQELDMAKLSKLSEKTRQERTAELNAEIKDLEKQANEIRKKNTREFEKILNKKQKAELEQMKSEGRARFEQKHPQRAPFQGLGTPQFLFKPLFMPPPWM